MKKLLLILDSDVRDIGNGATKTTLAISDILRGNTWEVSTYSLGNVSHEGSASYINTDKDLVKVTINSIPAFISNLYVSSIHAMRPWDLRRFIKNFNQVLDLAEPDYILITNPFLFSEVVDIANLKKLPIIFYFADTNYLTNLKQPPNSKQVLKTNAELFPSQALLDLAAQYYKLNFPLVLKDIIPQYFNPVHNLSNTRVQARKKRFITMVNPSLAKGGLFFLHLAHHAKTSLPDLKFRIVESRGTRSDFARMGLKLDEFSNLEWHPSTPDMTKIYSESSIVIVPSLYFEPSARVIAEAIRCGIPVMTMNQGGMVEQLNEGGFVFDIPKKMSNNFSAPPDLRDVQQWLGFIKVLSENDDIYAKAVQCAIKAAQIYSDTQAAERVLNLFSVKLPEHFRIVPPCTSTRAHNPQGSEKITVKFLKERISQTKNIFSQQFLTNKQSTFISKSSPIFIMGLVNSDINLVQQILASHPSVEVASNLASINLIANDFMSGKDSLSLNKRLFHSIDQQEINALASEYISQCQIERNTNFLYYIDSSLSNWLHLGLIYMLFPNAKIICLHREPSSITVDMCHDYPGGAHDLALTQQDMPGYIQCFSEFLSHFDEILPDKIYHLDYVELISNTMVEANKLMEYCELSELQKYTVNTSRVTNSMYKND